MLYTVHEFEFVFFDISETTLVLGIVYVLGGYMRTTYNETLLLNDVGAVVIRCLFCFITS